MPLVTGAKIVGKINGIIVVGIVGIGEAAYKYYDPDMPRTISRIFMGQPNRWVEWLTEPLPG